MFLTKSKLALAGVLIACTLTAGTAAVLGRQNDGSNPASAARAPDARTGNIETPASEYDATNVPDFIKQSRGMIIARLEQELALARTRLDRTLRRVSAPNDPAVLQARRTVAEIDHQLARIDGVLLNAVDRFPTMFDFSGGQVDLTAAPDRRIPARLGSSTSTMYTSLLSANPATGRIASMPTHSAARARLMQPDSAIPAEAQHDNDCARQPECQPIRRARLAQGQGNSPSSSAKSGDNDRAPSQNASSFGGEQGQGQGDSPSSRQSLAKTIVPPGMPIRSMARTKLGPKDRANPRH